MLPRQNDLRNNPTPTHELVRVAVDSFDAEAGRLAIASLHFRAERDTLEAARLLCESRNAIERAVGADILGQLGVPERAFPEEQFRILDTMAKSETDARVLNSVVVALGHLADARAVPVLVSLAQHESPVVREGVAFGLSGVTFGPAVDASIELSRDVEGSVRDWATFGLGLTLTSLERLVAQVRDALRDRLNDTDDDTRTEALRTLAEHKDERVVDAILRALESDEFASTALEAVLDFPSRVFVPRLIALRATDRCEHELLNRALAACLAEST
jgi:hypothetical protein